MSFSVSVKNTNIEYGGKGINAIFANRLNFFNIKFFKMLSDIIFFYNTAPSLLKNDLVNTTLGKYLDNSRLSKYFIDYHIWHNTFCLCFII